MRTNTRNFALRARRFAFSIFREHVRRCIREAAGCVALAGFRDDVSQCHFLRRLIQYSVRKAHGTPLCCASRTAAPYGSAARKSAFSVLVENGVYGGTAAAPAGAGIGDAAAKLGLIGQ